MTSEEKIDAVNRVIDLCKEYQSSYKMVSLRSGLVALQDFTPEEIQEVIQFVAANGFDYCLDHTIPMTGHHDASGETPNWQVCYWGPDQLASRLYGISGVKQRWED